jgi:hypothetical protein
VRCLESDNSFGGLTEARRRGKVARVRSFWLLLATFALGCERERAVERPDAGARPALSGPSSGERAVASVVASVRARELRIGAPEWQLQPLAFGRRLFVRLAADRVEVYAMPAGEHLYDYPVEAPRGTVEIAGGSVMVVAPRQSLRINPGAKEPIRLPPVPFLPGTLLVPDRRDSSGLWSVHVAGRLLARHLLAISDRRTLQGVVPLVDYDGGPITAMRDGALVYRANDGVRRAFPGGRAHALRSAVVPWRLLPGRRVDQVWAIAASGEVELWQTGDKIAVLARHALGAAPFDVAANSAYLAAVVVEEGSGAPRRFRLVVLSEKGEAVLRRDLGTDAPVQGERWASLAGQDRYVALAEPEPLVAVGGPGGFRVLSISSGETVVSR